MKKQMRVILAALGLLLLFCLTACKAEEMGSLKDITHPYTGIYQCERLTLGGRDMTEKFKKLALELKEDGSFEVSYLTAEGNEGSYCGSYAIDEARGEITLSAKTGLRQQRISFPYTQGTVCVDYNFLGNLLHAEFTIP